MNKFELNKKDVAILHSFTIFPWLTAEQVCSLHYSENSIKYVKARLAWLSSEKEHYVKRITYPKSYYPYFYTMALRGTRTIDTRPLFYPAKRPYFTHIDHMLLSNEVLISSLNLPGVLPNVTIEGIYHDFSLKTMLQEVVPDGWVHFHHNGESVPIWFEISIELREAKFKEKVRGILQSVRGEYRGCLEHHLLPSPLSHREKIK